MKEKVIYFPYTSLLEDQWLNQVLLYWDKIYTIDAGRYIQNPYMDKLIEHELLEKKNVCEGYVNNKNYESFLEYIDGPYSPVSQELQNPDKINWKNAITLFNEKMVHNPEIKKGLYERRLLRKQGRDYKVESTTAKLYMAYLAGVIGENKEVNATPITNSELNFPSFTSSTFQKYPNPIYKIHRNLLDSLLPAPLKPVTPEKIAKFKYKYDDQLTTFRSYLETQIEQIISIPDLETKIDSINRFKKEAQEDIEELTQRMESSGWGKITRGDWIILAGAGMGTFWPVIKMGIDVWTGTNPSISAEEIITTTISSTVLTGEVTRMYDHSKTKQEKLLDSDFVYVILTKKEFG